MKVRVKRGDTDYLVVGKDQHLLVSDKLYELVREMGRRIDVFLSRRPRTKPIKLEKPKTGDGRTAQLGNARAWICSRDLRRLFGRVPKVLYWRKAR